LFRPFYTVLITKFSKNNSTGNIVLFENIFELWKYYIYIEYQNLVNVAYKLYIQYIFYTFRHCSCSGRKPYRIRTKKRNSGYLGNIYIIYYFFISKLIANTIFPNHWVSVRKIIESNKSPPRYINPDIYSILVKKMMFPYDNISDKSNHNILHIFI